MFTKKGNYTIGRSAQYWGRYAILEEIADDIENIAATDTDKLKVAAERMAAELRSIATVIDEPVTCGRCEHSY